MAKGRMTARSRKAYPSKRRSTVKKPYGDSRYGNDAFVKVEKINPLATSTLGGGQVFSTMRVNQPLDPAVAGNTYLGDQAEFQSFQLLYARYEIVGMKAEVTLNPRYQWSSANLAGGYAPRIAQPAVFPSEDNNVSYPLQRDCNTQGEVSSLYYAYSKDLKNSGNRFAFSTLEAIPSIDQGILQFRGFVNQTTPNTSFVVGNIKFTWYIRFHGRTRGPTPAPRSLKYVAPTKAAKDKDEDDGAQSSMSYADLQQQLHQMMQNKAQ